MAKKLGLGRGRRASAKNQSRSHENLQQHRDRNLGGEEGRVQRRREHETGAAYEGE
jgi:hypothetical protein